MGEFAALLRGVNVGGRGKVAMAELRRTFEAMGFRDVTTLGASGNVVFTGPGKDARATARRVAAGLAKAFGREFPVHVRTLEDLRKLTGSDPYAGARLPRDAKRVLTFLEEPPKDRLALPIVRDDTFIVAIRDGVAFSAYVRGAKGAAFMTVLERTFGKGITTRTWDVVEKLGACGTAGA